MSKRIARERDLKNWSEVRDALVSKEIERERGRKAKKPLTDRHRAYMQSIEDNAVTIVTGPAGTAKTSLAVEVAARLFKQGRVRRIVLVRPLIECDEQTGFLPGDIGEKMAPFIAPLTQWLSTHFDAEELAKMWKQGLVQVVPLATMRGLDFQDCVVIIDEAQGATYRQLKMALTRVGENCRMVLCGDIRQSDLTSDIRAVPLLRVIDQLGKRPRIKSVSLVVLTKDDVLRSDLVRAIDARLTD